MLIGYARVSKSDGSQLLDFLKHLVSTVEALRERGVGLRVLAGAGAEIDTGTCGIRARTHRRTHPRGARGGAGEGPAGRSAAQDGPRHAADGDECDGGARDERAGPRAALLVPAWNPVARSVYIYKTAHHQRFRTDYRSLAVDAAVATAAAPTYFQRHVSRHAAGLSDGGTWANNPTALAVVEGIATLGWPRDTLHVLSLGCLDETYTIPKRAGIGTLGSKLIKLFMDGQSHGAMGVAKLLTGHEHERNAIHRIDHPVPSGSFRMDDVGVIQDLKGLGHSFARDRYPVLDPIFFHAPAGAFSPVYTLESSLDEPQEDSANGR